MVALDKILVELNKISASRYLFYNIIFIIFPILWLCLIYYLFYKNAGFSGKIKKYITFLIYVIILFTFILSGIKYLITVPIIDTILELIKTNKWDDKDLQETLIYITKIMSVFGTNDNNDTPKITIQKICIKLFHLLMQICFICSFLFGVIMFFFNSKISYLSTIISVLPGFVTYLLKKDTKSTLIKSLKGTTITCLLFYYLMYFYCLKEKTVIFPKTNNLKKPIKSNITIFLTLTIISFIISMLSSDNIYSLFDIISKTLFWLSIIYPILILLFLIFFYISKKHVYYLFIFLLGLINILFFIQILIHIYKKFKLTIKTKKT